jgi:hypothetical protein
LLFEEEGLSNPWISKRMGDFVEVMESFVGVVEMNDFFLDN